jgi:hypothetical protein
MRVLCGDSTHGQPNVKRPPILRDKPTDLPCCRATRGAAIPWEESSGAIGGVVRIGRVAKKHPGAHTQSIGDIRHSQTMGTQDLGPALARSGCALLPALLCQGNLRIQAYEALRSP